MGNENCIEVSHNFDQNQAYGDFQIVKQNSKTIALIQKRLQNDNELISEVKDKLQKRQKLKSHHLIKLQKYEIINGKYSTEVKMFYEFINKSLEDKYKQMYFQNQKQKSQFSERQLFNIIYGVQNALQQLNKLQIKHGCINLSTILCQGTFYKITDVSSTTFVKSYDLVKRGYRDQFLSPRLLANLQYRSLEPYSDIEDDLFSLGMIILTITSKVNSRYFYIWKQKTCTADLKWEAIQGSINRIEKNYSSKLSRKVKQLIKYERLEEKSSETNSTTANNANLTIKQKQTDARFPKQKSVDLQKKPDKERQKKVYTPKLQRSLDGSKKGKILMQSDNLNNLRQINQEIKDLDRDIDEILSRVNTSHTYQGHKEAKHVNKSGDPKYKSITQFPAVEDKFQKF